MSPPRSSSSQSMEENLKKAVIEMLVMLLLDEEDMHSAQITQTLEERADESLNLSFPYALLYRLIECGYIREAYKKNAPDGRRRQYYQITEEGRNHLSVLLATYRRFSENMERLMKGGKKRDGQ